MKGLGMGIDIGRSCIWTHQRHVVERCNQKAIIDLVDKGLKHAILYVDADNEKGLKLYDSLGFN